MSAPSPIASPAAARRSAVVTLALALAALTATAARATAVFDGDPIAPGGEPWVMLPGVPLLHPGPDGKWGTADDVVDISLTGDVDLAVRTGRGFAAGAGAIAPPSPSLAAAPRVVAGGRNVTARGSRLRATFVLSDGAAPGAGNALLTSDLDGRGVLAVAYADLDGDGILGPTADDDAGAADDALEAQEALTQVGRRLAVLHGGTATASLAVSLGLPRSTGGLGLVIAGGAATGSLPPVHVDAPWIATLLPAMWPVDPARIVGPNPRAADPLALVDVEVDTERMFRPPAAHPVIGTPFAIPLDGSSASNDLARSVSGPTRGVTIARVLTAAGHVADPGRRVLPAVAASGARRVVEALDAVALADDGPGNGAALVVFPADALGNQSDPPRAGAVIDLTASPNLRIVSPDSDGDPLHENIAFSAAGLADVVLDDAGGAADGGTSGHLVASLGGATAAAVRVHLGAGPLPGGAFAADADVRFSATPDRDRLELVASMDGSIGALDLAHRALSIALRDPAGEPVYERTLAAGALAPNAAGTGFRGRDPAGTPRDRVQKLVVRQAVGVAAPRIEIVLRVARLALAALDRDVASLTVAVAVGPIAPAVTVPCDLQDLDRLRCRP